MNAYRKVALLGVSLALGLAAAGGASAESRWDRHHPWRDQVNDRLARQSWRIHQERREGELTRGQAMALHREDRRIRQEERFMAAQNGGHLTRAERRVLNQQENGVSRQIGR